MAAEGMFGLSFRQRCDNLLLDRLDNASWDGEQRLAMILTRTVELLASLFEPRFFQIEVAFDPMHHHVIDLALIAQPH